jgi:hypothetical protein
MALHRARAQGKAVVGVAAGRYHSVALTSDGRVYSWGLNDWGQLGRRAELAADAGDAGSGGAGGGCTQGASCRSGLPGLVELPEGAWRHWRWQWEHGCGHEPRLSA